LGDAAAIALPDEGANLLCANISPFLAYSSPVIYTANAINDETWKNPQFVSDYERFELHRRWQLANQRELERLAAVNNSPVSKR
jgi:hypothetical protein